MHKTLSVAFSKNGNLMDAMSVENAPQDEDAAGKRRSGLTRITIVFVGSFLRGVDFKEAALDRAGLSFEFRLSGVSSS